MRYRNERGAVLPIALLILLLLIVMAAGFVYEIRTQSSFNSAVKLNSFYKMTAENELRRRIATMNDGINNNDWLSGSANTIGFVDQWK